VLPPTTKNDKRRTTTEAPAPTNAPPPPPDNGGDDDDDDDDDQAGAAQPPSASLNVASVGRRSARIRVNSNQCVATRFVLSGSDGSGQEGSTSGFNPAVSCSSGWNLNFAGSSRLTAGTSYTLTVWVKAVDSQLTNSASISFSTTA
jgi:hypothetical protein